MKMKALLIIDMQKVSFTEATPRFDREGIVQRINSLSEAFSLQTLPVIVIQHDGTQHQECVPGTEEWEVLDDVVVRESDHRVAKTANDCFYRSELKPLLDQLCVNEVVITGCATDFCVEATVQGAIVRDLDTTVVSNGHTTAERPELTAQQVIDHHNWRWQNMLPTKGTLRVIEHTAVLQELSNATV